MKHIFNAHTLVSVKTAKQAKTGIQVRLEF